MRWVSNFLSDNARRKCKDGAVIWGITPALGSQSAGCGLLMPGALPLLETD